MGFEATRMSTSAYIRRERNKPTEEKRGSEKEKRDGERERRKKEWKKSWQILSILFSLTSDRLN